MNPQNIKAFRKVFENEMNSEGFVWRYQTYIHVDFQQFWVLAVWPRITGQGHVFDIHYDLFLMSGFGPEDLKLIHYGSFLSMEQQFNMVDPNREPPFNYLLNTTENYHYAFEIYHRDVSPLFHTIHSSADAFHFRMTHAAPENESEYLELEVGSSSLIICSI